MLAIVSVGVADASTIEEVARCRAIAKRSEMVACFKALKEGKPAKTEDAAPASAQGAVSTKKDETAPAKTGGAASTNAEGAASSKREDIAPGKGGSAPPNAVPRSAPDEPETTSSINRQRAASDRPLCVDRDALAGMLVAGLLTSDQRWRLHGGCQTLPSDAKAEDSGALSDRFFLHAGDSGEGDLPHKAGFDDRLYHRGGLRGGRRPFPQSAAMTRFGTWSRQPR
jgi:hypothetical protein